MKATIDAEEPSQEQLSLLLQDYQNGRYPETEKLALTITQEFPKHPFAWTMLSIVLKQTGRISESLVPSQEAVALCPQDAEAHYNLGIALADLGRLDEAEASYTQAIAIKPNLTEAHYNLGVTLQELNRLDEAEASYKQAIALKTDLVEARSNLGITLHELGRSDEAEASYRQAIFMKPDYAEAHYNLGVTLHDLDKLDEAEASYRQAIALKSDYPEAHNNLGATLKEMGRLNESEASVMQAISLNPDFALATYCKSMYLLNRHEFQLGWSMYDPPRQLNSGAAEAYFTERAARWNGASLRKKNILVYSSQGVGDEIMFSSCIPDLIQKSPNAIYLWCDPRLQPLFARSFPEVITYGRERIRRSPQTYSGTEVLPEDTHFDYSIPIDGLPRFFRNKIKDFPIRNAFLVPNPECVDKWEKRLADLGEGLKIGISWLAGTPRMQKKSSIPLNNWKNLLSVDAFFINLQYGNTSAEVDQFTAENNIRIYDWEDNDALLDLDNQAALISKLDLVISVDNATVHSCIALGTEVWNLADLSLNLMWMENGTDNSPLSSHVRFFKKKYQDSWGTVLNLAEGELREKINTQR